MKPARDKSLEDAERFDRIPRGGEGARPPVAYVEFRPYPQLEAMIDLATPLSVYLILAPDGPNGEGAIAYTNLRRDLAMKMVAATIGEPLKWIDRDGRV